MGQPRGEKHGTGNTVGENLGEQMKAVEAGGRQRWYATTVLCARCVMIRDCANVLREHSEGHLPIRRTHRVREDKCAHHRSTTHAMEGVVYARQLHVEA